MVLQGLQRLLLGAVGDAMGRIAGRFRGPLPRLRRSWATGISPADACIAQTANEAGQSINDIPQSLLRRLSIANGRQHASVAGAGSGYR